MAEARQKMRGTSIELDQYLGKEGQICYNLTNGELRVYDGISLGGKRFLNRDSTVALINDVIVSGTVNNSLRLGGELPAFYRDAANLNAGVLPAARLVGNYSFAKLTLSGDSDIGGKLTVAGATVLSGNLTGYTATFSATLKVENNDPILQVLESDTGGDGRVRVIGGNLCLQSSGDIRLTGISGTDVSAVYIRNSSNWYTVWHTGNLAAPVQTSRSIIAGNGLSGGGTLAADRTITLGTPTTITATSTNSVTTTSHTHDLTLTSANIISFLGYTPASNAISIVAGNGLSGGGTLSASRTITLGTPGSITNSTENTVSSTSHTHALGIIAAEVSTTTSNGTTSFGLGHFVAALVAGNVGVPNRNGDSDVRIHGGNSSQYLINNVGTALAGTWRSRGSFTTGGSGSPECIIAQRTA